jgi:hypothetical protein
LAYCGLRKYQSFSIEWPWGGMQMSEHGGRSQPLPAVNGNIATLGLESVQVRVFAI